MGWAPRLCRILLHGALALGVFACAPSQIALPSLPMPSPNLTSFLDVRFGERLTQVQIRYPNGSTETSPYGAEAYRLEHLSADSIHYQSVIYEFTEHSGMQLAIATFATESAAVGLKISAVANDGPSAPLISPAISTCPFESNVAVWPLRAEVIVFCSKVKV